jgi:DNA polymerase-1
VYVNSICGGDGLCGKCRVIVREGEVKSKPTALLNRNEIRDGYILACETQVLGTLTVEVPEESRLTGKPPFTGEEAMRFGKDSAARGRVKAYAFEPLSRKLFLAMSPPSLDDNLGDLERVYREINAASAHPVMQTGLFNLRNLSFDTMMAAHLLGEKALGLKPLAFGRLSLEMKPITDLICTGPRQLTMAQVEVGDAAQYGCADADVTGRLKALFEEELRREGFWKLFTEVEMPLVPVLFRMEQNGVALDRAVLREMSQALGQEMLRLEAEVYNSVGHQFNINSPKQLAAVLFEELNLPRDRRTKSGYSTDAAVLEGLKGAHPIIEPLLQYRQVAKLKSTYIDALPELVDPASGRLHTSFNQTGTVTGRLSSSEPNLQNIPIRTEEGRRIRGAFIAQSGWRLLGADYSQIDLRVLAHLSQDPGLVAAFARNEDIHRATASQVFGVPMEQVTPEMRRVAKTVNFGVIYGMSEYGLEQATDLSREQASQFISAYFEKYRGVKDYLERTLAQARERGYVETVLGRRRRIPEIDSSNRQVKAAAERMAVNMPVQGTSADIIKVAMIQLQRRMDEQGLKTMMTLQVHDELLFEVPPHEMEEMKRLVQEIMPHALELSVPIKVDLKEGRNWGEME